jgi:ABC-type uncharacterized transport system substrate-binding protein
LFTIDAVAAPKVLVVLSKSDTPHENFVQALWSSLGASRSHVELAVQPLNGFSDAILRERQPALIVSVGADAARNVAKMNPAVPILHTLIPRALGTEVRRQARKGQGARDSAIYLDQPIARQLDLLRIALPAHKRVAAILSPNAKTETAELRKGSVERGFKLNIETVEKREKILPALEEALENAQVVVSVPDPLIYYGDTIHHMLLMTYRYRVPVIGLSKAHVDAGALLAVYSTTEHIGKQAGEILASLPVKGEIKLPSPQSPRYFTVSVNRRVAASLDLTLDDDSVLLRKLGSIKQP